MRQSSNIEGLSNSAILSMCRDDNGFLWIGTCDGVNISDGTSIYPFSQLFPGQTLSGNVIETIVNGDNNIMWVLTNHGLNLVDTESRTITTYSRFGGQELMAIDDDGTLFIMTEDSKIHLHRRKADGDFLIGGQSAIPFNKTKSIRICGNNLLIFASDGIYYLPIEHNSKGEALKIGKTSRHIDIPINFAQTNHDEMFIVDDKGILFEISPEGNLSRITDLSQYIAQRGHISHIIRNNQVTYYISFSTEGAIRISKNDKYEFQATNLKIPVGVFCLEKSKDQNVVWIGSDCRGVYTIWDDLYNVRSFDFNTFGNKISNPVRSIFVDDKSNIWLGTKGDGILRVEGFDDSRSYQNFSESTLYTSFNSDLHHNSVFAFGKSKRPILWIATENGLNYYNYADNRIHKADLGKEIKFMHGVVESNDSTLWMCTLGNGIIKARISGNSDHPTLSDIKIYSLDNGEFSSNQFFSITIDEKGDLLFCNRGRGMYHLKNDSLCSIPLRGKYSTNAIYDVFDAIKSDSILWLGTGNGLLKMDKDGEKHFFGPQYGFTNNTIHEMIRDNDGKIWISTNDGLIRYNPENDETLKYGRNYGITISEFSDGASFSTPNTLIFGGINGIATVSRNKRFLNHKPFTPSLHLLSISISGIDVPLSQHFEQKKNIGYLRFNHDQNHFSLTFAVPDFINGENYTYYYSIDGHDWINNGSNPTISFNQMSYGNFSLKVRYLNRASGVESEPYSLNIMVIPPWYLSDLAKGFYLLIIISALFYAARMYLRRQRERQEEAMSRLEQTHKEELYEEKLRFFTNITHEFCTPLTLIYGPCERVLTYPGADDYVKKYINLIRMNTERLNNLIQELIDFRRTETGHKTLKIRETDISRLCSDIMTSFSELSDRNNITFVKDFPADMLWNSDFGCLRKVITNLISNAFKYTSPGGTIKVSMRIADNKLTISVYNTGKGIREEDKERIFNRYSVLDNVEENAVKGLSHRNGLGMAICHSMVDMLRGSIEINSEVGSFAEFVVTLPYLETNSSNDTEKNPEKENIPTLAPETETTSDIIATKKPDADGKDTILVIDDNTEILTLLADSLSDYNVITAENAEEGLNIIKESAPDLIISDIMMPGTNGMDLTRQIKQNRHTMHIPLVLLSAKNSTDEKVEGIESGADAYIGKPFSISYLKAVAKRLLENRNYLKEYYNSSASVFEYNKGQLIHKEDKDFIDSISAFIETHIDDSSLSPDHLANHMKISVRNLYRKFKDLGQVPPNDFIKSQRISYAAKLLLTTSLTVQEIIYRSGFTNRSHFYKEFDKRFSMTPKDYRTANTQKDYSLSE